MKQLLLWALAGAWLVIFGFLALDSLASENPILEADRLRVLRAPLTGLGALAIGVLPPLLLLWWRRVRNRRLRQRLEKERLRIDRQLARLDEREGRAPGERASSLGADDPAAKDAQTAHLTTARRPPG